MTAKPAAAAPASSRFYALASRVEAATTAAELGFAICNDTRLLVDYRQAALVVMGSAPRPSRLVAHSGLADVDPNTPYALWLSGVTKAIAARCAELPANARVLPLSPDLLDEELATAWSEWFPAQVWVLPLMGPDKTVAALLFLGRDEPWPTTLTSDGEEFALLHMAGLYGYAWWSLVARPSRVQRWWRAATSGRRLRYIAVGLLVVLLLPVREYTLVPAEIISLHSQVIASPREGVIRRMVILPNAAVKAGQVLAELDDTTLRNKLAVAQAELATANVEMHQAAQQAIESQNAKADLGMAEGKLHEREVDVASLQREVEKLEIRAPVDGVFVYSDPDDWAGRPVQTGERIGLLADPHTLGVRAWAPVGEPTNLEGGAPMTVFLKTAPLSPIGARLDYAGYQSVESPTGVASYVLRGTVDGDASAARIGLQGTARVSGRWSVLGYLLLRRPLATVRAWCGV
ncbi:efflux RND transporter periplasmic adaptor subunit [Luteibacter aegosomatissinici]|uniref:efflux RND transporter periplasmic adaptor subunit n=1 Tax=Luteibacter aegosomatissinici TaxID=2911539 RepID=UPI001FF90808|nr:HlyD family efflux transporter periplasmic adaptor subunit [Luteibacter aegosomatissinici]UPG93829.1 HlyD family efflux transporter periplasmic adaptor subunit [Luteibacter aegosomatissinici]